MPKPLERAAIGLRAHSGWAALVAVAGSFDSPIVIARRRIETWDPSIRGSKQPFHAAEPLELSEAKPYIDHCTSTTRKLSRDSLEAAIDGLRDKRYEAVCCGIVLGSGRTLPDLKGILASHALIHTAEGEFYRNALLEAAEHCGLAIHGIKEKELLDKAAAEFSIKREKLESRLTEIGKPLGAPWTQDQKYAALTGWMALANQTSVR
jgi:hypothetical protein